MYEIDSTFQKVMIRYSNIRESIFSMKLDIAKFHARGTFLVTLLFNVVWITCILHLECFFHAGAFRKRSFKTKVTHHVRTYGQMLYFSFADVQSKIIKRKLSIFTSLSIVLV